MLVLGSDGDGKRPVAGRGGSLSSSWSMSMGIRELISGGSRDGSITGAGPTTFWANSDGEAPLGLTSAFGTSFGPDSVGPLRFELVGLRDKLDEPNLNDNDD